jgi:multidrug efflux pump subunit AcrB
VLIAGSVLLVVNRVAKQVRGVFEKTPDIVGIDDSVEFLSAQVLVVVDRAKAARLGVERAAVAQALATVLAGEDMSYLHGANVKHAVPIHVEYDAADKADLEQVLALRVRAMGGQLVPLSEITENAIRRAERYARSRSCQPDPSRSL